MNFAKYTQIAVCGKCHMPLNDCTCEAPDPRRAYLVPVRDTPPDLPCYSGSETTPCDCISYCGDDSVVPPLWDAIRKSHAKK